jgi:hypothetical protein
MEHKEYCEKHFETKLDHFYCVSNNGLYCTCVKCEDEYYDQMKESELKMWSTRE